MLFSPFTLLRRSSFSPLDLPGLLAWYSADSGVYNDAGVTLATNTQTVQQWNDRSGNGYHLKQATSGNRPQYLSAGFNSKQTVQFTAATPTGMATTTDAVVTGSSNLTSGFFVGQMLTSTEGFGRAVSFATSGLGDTSSGSRIWVIRAGVANAIEAYRSGDIGPQNISLATNLRFGVVFDGVNGTTYLNNANPQATANADTFVSPGTISVGRDGGTGWDGPISEIVITTSALNSGHRTLLDNYFRTKWGL